METLKWLLDKINGRKTTIATILGAIITFCLGRGYLAVDVAELLSVILVALGIGANYANAKLDKI